MRNDFAMQIQHIHSEARLDLLSLVCCQMDLGNSFLRNTNGGLHSTVPRSYELDAGRLIPYGVIRIQSAHQDQDEPRIAHGIYRAAKMHPQDIAVKCNQLQLYKDSVFVKISRVIPSAEQWRIEMDALFAKMVPGNSH
jgi:hypothetical protein